MSAEGKMGTPTKKTCLFGKNQCSNLLLDNSCYNIYTSLDVSNKKNIDILLMFLQDKNNSILNKKSINYTTLDKLFKYIRRLKYNQAPNYDYIIILLNMIYTP